MTSPHEIRLDFLEGPITDAHLMASIVATLMVSFRHTMLAYRQAPRMAAPSVAIELEEDVDRLQFATFRLEEMLRQLKADYLAPLNEVKA